jgi:FAD binding domain
LAQLFDPVRAVHILREFQDSDSIYFSPIEEILTDPWVQGRVALIGDAAHATSPNMAEGASMALEAALVVTRMLVTQESPDEALSAFTERRRARLNWFGNERIAGIEPGLCLSTFAISLSVLPGRPCIGETINRCSTNDSAMADTVENLILDLLEWAGRKERTYQETMDAWRTSCPKLPVWEDATERGPVETAFLNGRSLVRVTPEGLALLKEKRPR